MNEIKTFKNHKAELEIGSFDNDKEIEFCIEQNKDTIASVWLTANQVNGIINHLAKCLKSINEPVEILTKEN